MITFVSIVGMVGSFVLFSTYEKTAVATEYSEIVGLEEVEVFLSLTRLPISECKKIRGASLQCQKIGRSLASTPSDLWIRQFWIRSRSFSLDPPLVPKPSVHLLLEPILDLKPFIFFGSALGSEAVCHFLWDPQPDPEPYRSLGRVPGSGITDHSNIDPSSGFRV